MTASPHCPLGRGIQLEVSLVEGGEIKKKKRINVCVDNSNHCIRFYVSI